MSELGTFLKLFDDGGCVNVEAGQEQAIDAAVQRWIDSRGTHDTLLDLVTIEGESYRVKASIIQSWIVSTVETRRRTFELSLAYEDERREFRQELGIWIDGDDDG